MDIEVIYPNKKIERLVKNEILQNLGFIDLDICVECIKGKQTKHTNEKGAARSTQLFELMYTNISRLYDVTSCGGEMYFITFIDDFSGMAIFICYKKNLNQ